MRVLATAEVLAIPYYTALRDATGSPLLRSICDRILAEETEHLRFQAFTFGRLASHRAALLRTTGTRHASLLSDGDHAAGLDGTQAGVPRRRIFAPASCGGKALALVRRCWNASLFTPQAEGFLRGTIGEAEEDGVFRGLVRNGAPGRRDEDVARGPFEGALADAAGSLPFGDTIDRGVRRAIRRALESGRQRLQKRAERGSDGSAVGLRVLDLYSMTRMQGFVPTRVRRGQARREMRRT